MRLRVSSKTSACEMSGLNTASNANSFIPCTVSSWSVVSSANVTAVRQFFSISYLTFLCHWQRAHNAVETSDRRARDG
jgi:hypothetical protein